ncbi:MAG: zinc-ribbon domain-containing protein [Lachnospiraceae bacterium]|nr:zinc-ribbon domain-containing protein [Lachnospiraceae bacterium]
MSLIKCPECGKDVSNNASVCPNCGYSIRKNANASSGNHLDSNINEVNSEEFN